MTRTQTQRGSVLLYSMLTMSVMLAIGLTLTSLFVGKLRAATAARNATVALYAADSGVEMCLYEARAGVDDPPVGTPLAMTNGATITIVNAAGNGVVSGNCSVLGAGSFGFRATGLYNGSSRTLEISQ